MAYTLGTNLFQNYKNQHKAIALSYFVKGGRTPAQLATLYITLYKIIFSRMVSWQWLYFQSYLEGLDDKMWNIEKHLFAMRHFVTIFLSVHACYKLQFSFVISILYISLM